ncbi:hypothetical protein [Nocardia concava]|uniref:hypothetical protein n=1 Tax=Nocardia concava TaxID=257281 RepID=UPI00031B6ADC|nr:hypothetical protein [Nocardia concava]
MDGSALVPILVLMIGFFGPMTLLVLRWRKIRRHGIGGGEFNHPLSTAGYGGVPPGTVIQEDFGGITTVQTQTTGTAAGPDIEGRWLIGENSKPRSTTRTADEE